LCLPWQAKAAEEMLKAKLKVHVSNGAYMEIRRSASHATLPSPYMLNKVMKRKKKEMAKMNFHAESFSIPTSDPSKPCEGVRTSLAELLKHDVHKGLVDGTIKEGDVLHVREGGDGRDLGKRGKNNSVLMTATLLNLGHEHLQTNIHTVLLMKGSEEHEPLRLGKQCDFNEHAWWAESGKASADLEE
jgi:hypothetical protein